MTQRLRLPPWSLRGISAAGGLILGLSLLAAEVEHATLPELPVTSITLDNGLTLLIQEDHTYPRIAFEVRVKGGSCDDAPWVGSGLAHLMEHMLFKGTERRPVGSVETEVRRYQGSMNAFTSYDYTGYSLEVGSAYLREGLDLLADVLFHAAFDPTELGKEQAVVRSEMQMNRDDPERRLMQRFWATAFQVHPYRHPIIGYEAVFSQLGREEILAFYRRRYVPNNMVLAIVGDVTTAKVRALAEELFGARPQGPPFDWLRASEPPQLSPRNSVEEFPVTQAHLMLGFHSTRLQDPDLYALDVLAQVLGQGESSRLEQRLRRDRGLVHQIQAWNMTPQDAGLLTVVATTDPEKVEEATQEILKEMTSIAHDGVTEAELSRAKRMVEADYLFARQSLSARAGDVASYALLVGDPLFGQRYVEGIQTVTGAAVQRVAQRYVVDGAWTLATLIPQREPAPTPPPATPAPGIAWQTTQLTNGATVVVGRDPRAPLVALRAVWRGGLRAESPEQAGLSNVTAQLILGGTAQRSAAELVTAVESRGGRISAFSGKDALGITLDLLARDLPFGVELLHELMTQATFPEQELAREQARITAQIHARSDDIFEMTGERLREALLGAHPYARHPLGTAVSVARVTTAACREFYRRYIVPQHLVLVVVGDVEPEATIRRLTDALGALPRSATPALDASAPAVPSDTATVTATMPGREQAVIALGFPGAAWTAKDRYALEIVAAILSGSAGRLYQQLREAAGLSYTLGAYHVAGEVGGYLTCYVATTPATAEEVSARLIAAIEALTHAAPSAAEVELAKRALLDHYYRELQTVGAVAMRTAVNVVVGLGVDELAQYPARIARLTPEDIARVIHQYLGQVQIHVQMLPEAVEVPP